MNKTITINPDLFKVGGKGSRKKTKTSSDTGGIKVRSPKENKKTIKKNHVLRFLRENQEKNMKELMKSRDISAISAEPVEEFKSDFNKSLEYLNALVEEKTQRPSNHNSSLKRYNNFENSNSLILHPSVSASDLLNVSGSIVPPILQSNSGIKLAAPRYPIPTYGCLKGGQLPTYRNYKNITQKNYPQMGGIVNSLPVNSLPVNSLTVNSLPVNSLTVNSLPVNSLPSPTTIISDKPIEEAISINNMKREEIKQTVSKNLEQGKLKKMRYPKQKRTVRRTFKVGKSKTQPKISVLISNKTLRNQISTKTHLLRQTPIQEVRRFLTKKGFIRVGSDAPNDVLRKMYESTVLICGDVQNHNPDNLLYNFLNDIHP